MLQEFNYITPTDAIRPDPCTITLPNLSANVSPTPLRKFSKNGPAINQCSLYLHVC